MRGIVPGRHHARRSRSPVLRETVLSAQHPLRAFLADAAASVRRVYGGPVSYCALSFERVDWDHFDVVGVNHYRQIQGLTAERYLAKIGQLHATGKPVAITEFGATHPGVGWEPKEAFHAIARYYRQQEPGLRPAQG
jgi:hypothetical protein